MRWGKGIDYGCLRCLSCLRYLSCLNCLSFWVHDFTHFRISTSVCTLKLRCSRRSFRLPHMGVGSCCCPAHARLRRTPVHTPGRTRPRSHTPAITHARAPGRAAFAFLVFLLKFLSNIVVLLSIYHMLSGKR